MNSTPSIFCRKVNDGFKRIPSTLPGFTAHALKYFTWNFNNPQKDYKIVQVAGTNGKGSVSIKTAALLEKSGFKTGLFTSPHISSVRERIQINREMIPQNDFVKYYEICEEFEKDTEIKLSFFQMMLSMALIYFQEEKCDYVILECGIGGLTSATNVVDSDFAAITSIGFDHRDLLGPTEKHICRDKAGIIRENIPLVVGPTIPLDVIEPICKVHNSKLIVVDDETKNFIHLNKNIAYALFKEIIESWEEIPHQLNEEEVEEALKASPDWRMDKIPLENIKNLMPDSEFYPISSYMDVGHNSAALQSLLNTIHSTHKDIPDLVVYVIATFSKGKEIDSALQTLISQVKDVRIVVIKHFKLIQEEEAQEHISQIKSSESSGNEKINDLFQNGDLEENVKAALNDINEKEHSNAILLHWGSVFLMEYIRDLYEIPQIKDMEDLNSQI